jgi:hypothetical protein
MRSGTIQQGAKWKLPAKQKFLRNMDGSLNYLMKAISRDSKNESILNLNYGSFRIGKH